MTGASFFLPLVGGWCLGLHVRSKSPRQTLSGRPEAGPGHRAGAVRLSAGETDSEAPNHWNTPTTVGPVLTSHSGCLLSFLSSMRWSWDASALKETWIEPGSMSCRYGYKFYTQLDSPKFAQLAVCTFLQLQINLTNLFRGILRN